MNLLFELKNALTDFERSYLKEFSTKRQVYQDITNCQDYSSIRAYVAGKARQFKDNLSVQNIHERIAELLLYQEYNLHTQDLKKTPHHRDLEQMVFAYYIACLYYAVTLAHICHAQAVYLDEVDSILSPYTQKERQQAADIMVLPNINEPQKIPTPPTQEPHKKTMEEYLEIQEVKNAFEKLRKAGFVDNKFQWIKAGHTNYQRAIAAYEIKVQSKQAMIPYNVFETFWNCNSITSDLAKANQLNNQEKNDEVRNAIGC